MRCKRVIQFVQQDLIEGMIRMMDQDDEPGPVNLGNPVEHSMLELAEKVLQATDSSASVMHVDLPQDDPRPHDAIGPDPDALSEFRAGIDLGGWVNDRRAHEDVPARTAMRSASAARPSSR